MNTKASKIFSKVFLADKTVNIKLLGDSITHGVGGTGFEMNGEHIVGDYYRSPEAYCWARQFKEFMESNYNCTVTNNACTGTKIEFVLEHFDTLVSEQDDIVLCTIGTNNRHQYYRDAPMHTKESYLRGFYENVLRLNECFEKSGKDYVLMANIPASPVNEQGSDDYARIFHMCDVNDVYTKAAGECGFAFISMYNLFLEYCDVRNIDYTTLLCDGLHPNNKGYDVMFHIIMQEIGLGKRIY